MLPAQKDLAVYRGSAGSYPKKGFRLKDGNGVAVAMAGNQAHLTVYGTLDLPGGKGQRSYSYPGQASDAGTLQLDPDGVTIWWVPAEGDTLAIPEGSTARYEYWIIYADGSKGPYMVGHMSGVGRTDGGKT